MAEQKEFNSEKIITWGLSLSTILYIGGIGYLFGCDVWGLTQNNHMGEAGDFIAGFTTPVAFLWLIYGYFLQRRELGLQRKELRQTRETLGEQVRVLEEQAKAERRRSMPRISLEPTGRETAPFILRNIGGLARNLKAKAEGTTHTFSQPLLDTDGEFNPRIARPPHDPLYYTVCFTSELHERFYQRWSIRFAGNLLPLAEEITKGPMLLEDGQSAPELEIQRMTPE